VPPLTIGRDNKVIPFDADEYAEVPFAFTAAIAKVYDCPEA
jgi:hypothetical protein